MTNELIETLPYLPYGLKMQVEETGTIFEANNVSIVNGKLETPTYCKSLPILLPLSEEKDVLIECAKL